MLERSLEDWRWGLVTRRVVSLQELETHWTLGDCARAWQSLHEQHEREAKALERARGER